MDSDMHGLVGAFSVDALSEEERAAFEQHLKHCDRCRRELRFLRETVASVGLAADEPPPEALRARVLAAVAQTRQQRVLVALRTRPRRTARLLAGVAALLSVAVMALGVVSVRSSQQVERLQAQLAASAARAGSVETQLSAANARAVSAEARLAASNARAAAAESRLVALLAAPDARTVELAGGGLRARLVYSRERGEGTVFDEDMPSLPPGQTYQLWLIGSGSATSVAVFEPDPQGQVALTIDRDFADALAVGVSLEPDGGSPQPTTVLLTGALT